jgi:hypothetical protein
LFGALLCCLLLFRVALSLLSLLLLFPLLPLGGALRFMLSPTLVALGLVFLLALLTIFITGFPAFLSTTATTLRTRDGRDAD